MLKVGNMELVIIHLLMAPNTKVNGLKTDKKVKANMPGQTEEYMKEIF